VVLEYSGTDNVHRRVPGGRKLASRGRKTFGSFFSRKNSKWKNCVCRLNDRTCVRNDSELQ
jgi:hypothetical protein